MKQIILSFMTVGLLGACCRLSQIHNIPVKHTVANYSIAFPLSIDASGQAGTIPNYLNALKDELRSRGWKIIVSGVTGRAGANNSINHGADFTVLGVEEGCDFSYSIVQNSTGEEVLITRGQMGAPWCGKTLVKATADELERLVERK